MASVRHRPHGILVMQRRSPWDAAPRFASPRGGQRVVSDYAKPRSTGVARRLARSHGP